MCLRTLKNSGRAVQTDPTLLRFGDHGTKKCWELLAQKFDRLQTFATTCNSKRLGERERRESFCFVLFVCFPLLAGGLC